MNLLDLDLGLTEGCETGSSRGLCLGAVIGIPVLSCLEVTRVDLGHGGTRTEGFSPWGRG